MNDLIILLNSDNNLNINFKDSVIFLFIFFF